MRRLLPTALLLVATSAAAVAQSVLIVDPGQIGAFDSIQAGIDAADDGDVVLIRDGIYFESPLVDGRGIVLLGEGTVDVRRTVTIRNVPLASTMIVAGLSVTGRRNQERPALDCDNCQGLLRVIDCQLNGSSDVPPSAPTPTGPGAAISLSRDVAIIDSQLTAGTPGSYEFAPFDALYSGAPGLEAHDVQRLSLVRCALRGGEGMTDIGDRGGDGGQGAQVAGVGTTYVAYSALIGGRGGLGGLGPGTFSGDGGIGFFTDSMAFDFAGVFIPGTEGCPNGFGCDPGEPGAPTGGTGAIAALDGIPTRLSAPLVVREGEAFTLEVNGPNGHTVRLITGERSRTTFRPRAKQPLLIERPAVTTFDPIGTITSGMQFTSNRTAGSLNGTDQAQVMWLQAQLESPSGQRVLSSPRLMVVLAAGL